MLVYDKDMSVEVLGAAVALIAVLLWIHRDLRHDVAEMRADVRALNARIDNILLARRQA